MNAGTAGSRSIPPDRQSDLLSVAGCLRPGVVLRSDLMAYADGDAPPHAAEHIRRCPACAEESRALATAERQLRRALNRFECPAPQLLGEYALALLAPAELQRLAAHIADCPRCAEELQTLRSFLTVEPEPSPSALDRLRRVIATLVTPARGAAVFAELRGTESAVAPLIYRTEDMTITLSVQPDELLGGIRHWALHGLMVRDSGPLLAAQTRLIAPDGTLHEADLDDLGNFFYEGLPAGTYQLEVALSEHVVVVQELRIGGD
jgi:hypothetical protein